MTSDPRILSEETITKWRDGYSVDLTERAAVNAVAASHEALRSQLSTMKEALAELLDANWNLDSAHPLQYGFRDGHAVVGYEADDKTVVDRMNRCMTCEEWSPCSVREAVLGARRLVEQEGKP